MALLVMISIQTNLRMTHRLWLLLFLCFVGISSALSAQTTYGPRKDSDFYDRLKETTQKQGLVVVVESNVRQIESLQGLLTNSRLSTKQRARLQKRIAAAQTNTRFKYELFYGLFAENYKASAVHFVADTALTSILAGRRTGVALGEDMEISPGATLPEGDLVYAYLGSIDSPYPGDTQSGITLRYENGQTLMPAQGEHAFLPFNRLFIGYETWVTQRYEKAIQNFARGMQQLLAASYTDPKFLSSNPWYFAFRKFPAD